MEGHRRGFVLAAALLSVLLIAALMAAVFFATTEETRTTAAASETEHALTEAESALTARVEAIAGGLTAAPSPGETESVSDPAGRWSVYVTRLDSTILWVVGEGYGDQRMKGAVRRVGVFLALGIDSAGSIRVSRIPDRGWSELY